LLTLIYCAIVKLMMKTTADHTYRRAQTSVEYLLLLTVVAVVVIASFSPGSLIDQVRISAASYYTSITKIIQGNAVPAPIAGGLCPAGPGETPACECPVPAFGGAPC
jgi:Flp pilus assembly pilin Flp